MKPTINILILSLATLSPIPAQFKVDTRLRARFGFQGPMIKKLETGISHLQIVSTDTTHPVIVNNRRRARIELLGIGEDKLQHRWEGTGGQVQGVIGGDFDGDGVMDLALLTSRGKLEIRPGNKNARPPKPIEIGQASYFRAGDLNGDGCADLVFSSPDGLRIAFDLTSKPHLTNPDPLPSKLYDLELFDADGDGRLDLVAGYRKSIRIRLGIPGGKFGPWLVKGVDSLYSIFSGSGSLKKPTIATLEGERNRLVEYRLEKSKGLGLVEYHPLKLKVSQGTIPFTRTDLDGDGDLDLIVVDCERARLHYFFTGENGFRQAQGPCPAVVSTITTGDINGDGRQDLLLASEKEKCLAWKDGTGQLADFPARLPVIDSPLAAVMAGNRILFISRDKNRKANLWEIPRGEDGSFGKPQKKCELGRMSSRPTGIGAAELDGKAGLEIFFTLPRQGFKVIFADGKGGFLAPQGELPGAGFTKGLSASAMKPIIWQGKPAIFALCERYERIFRFDSRQQPLILAQTQTPAGLGKMDMAVIKADGSHAFFSQAKNKLYLAPVTGPPNSIDLPDLAPNHLLAQPGVTLLLSASGIYRLNHGRGGLQLKPLRTVEPPDPETRYFRGLAADLDGDGKREIALVDDHTHSVHLWMLQDKKLKPALAFPIFELDSERGRLYEPRSFVAGDINGDGLIDLAMICRDRVLLYPQEK